MAHAEVVPLVDHLLGHVGEVALAVVVVHVEPGEVGVDEQVEVAVAVEVDERAGERAAEALGRKAGGLGHVGEAAGAVVDE